MQALLERRNVCSGALTDIALFHGNVLKENAVICQFELNWSFGTLIMKLFHINTLNTAKSLEIKCVNLCHVVHFLQASRFCSDVMTEWGCSRKSAMRAD
jgi:hypothetical protein